LPPALALLGFALAAAASLLALLKVKGDLLEASLGATANAAERRLRIQQGRRLAATGHDGCASVRLPKRPLFCGVGAIVWKNFVVARRSKRELLLAFGVALVFTLPLAALLRLHHTLMNSAGISAGEALNFHLGVASFL